MNNFNQIEPPKPDNSTIYKFLKSDSIKKPLPDKKTVQNSNSPMQKQDISSPEVPKIEHLDLYEE